MDVLKIFLIGFSLYYFIQLADLIMQLLSSYISILITKCNARIIEISGEDKVDDNYRVGFHYEPVEDYYYEKEIKILRNTKKKLKRILNNKNIERHTEKKIKAEYIKINEKRKSRGT